LRCGLQSGPERQFEAVEGVLDEDFAVGPSLYEEDAAVVALAEEIGAD
jgi:hypothetical protein